VGNKALRAQLAQLLKPLLGVIYDLRADLALLHLDRLEGMDDLVHLLDHAERVPNVLPVDLPLAHELDPWAPIVDPAPFAGGGIVHVPVAEKAPVPGLDHGEVLDAI